MTTPDLITLTDPRSRAAEAYRTLRTNLLLSGGDAALRTLLVTSPSPNDDKSLAAANLAVTLAQSGRRTVLVDADLRHPQQGEIWRLLDGPGLSTMVLDGLDDAPLVDVGVPGLSVLPAGPLAPNPADLLDSARMVEVIHALAGAADVVLFDAPPVLAVTDAVLLGTRVDGALLVVRAGATRREDAEKARELLERPGVRILGALLTNAEVDARMSRYYGA